MENISNKETFTDQFLNEAKTIIQNLNRQKIEELVEILCDIKANGGRIFFVGVGGSAANCSHAVNDFRKIAQIECYAPTDNVSELTARTNDEGWDTIFIEWLKTSKFCSNDCLFVFSVGGGNLQKNISPNIVKAIELAQSQKSKILGIVGRKDGYAAEVADCCVIVPEVNQEHVTPHSEAFQAVIWHLVVSHPLLKSNSTKWESSIK